MLDLDHVANLWAQAITYDLEIPDSMRLASLEQVASAYNGIGPDWLPSHLRSWLTGRFGYFEAAALVHDWEYQYAQDRSHKAFTACNERLRRNCKALLAKGCPWYKRPMYRRRPDLLADACQICGWGAWND